MAKMAHWLITKSMWLRTATSEGRNVSFRHVFQHPLVSRMKMMLF